MHFVTNRATFHTVRQKELKEERRRHAMNFYFALSLHELASRVANKWESLCSNTWRSIDPRPVPFFLLNRTRLWNATRPMQNALKLCKFSNIFKCPQLLTVDELLWNVVSYGLDYTATYIRFNKFFSRNSFLMFESFTGSLISLYIY